MHGIKNLIICNPYVAPTHHWWYDRSQQTFKKVIGRRPAGFLKATQPTNTFDDPGEFIDLNLVNLIREKISEWRAAGYPHITNVTRKLLKFWHDKNVRENPFFFCQLEAIETLIWLVETPDVKKQGINIPSDGGMFKRLCCKMATGTGKTVVMAMLIAWQVINSITYPHDARFSKNILVVTPGLTVKSRLQVLYPALDENFYDTFNIVPNSLRHKLHAGKICIHNWHTLMPEADHPRSVLKRGEESDEAFSRRILEHLSRNIVVINDEAHHAYRANTEQAKKISKSVLVKDKRWVEGLDKIHAVRSIVHCFDFSATPFIPSGKNVSENTLFGWIVSDFSLNDAIESGLTKTPRIAIRDDSGQFTSAYRSRFYHIYMDDDVKQDLNKKAKPNVRLPELIHNAYILLGRDWLETYKTWMKNGSLIPPVMITVCNRTETAARIAYSFEKNKFEIINLANPDYLLHIDSAQIAKEESGLTGSVGKLNVHSLREIASTVGKHGAYGEQIRNVIAVQMLSEGWDARNVTHIMGLRAFTSQLLCEQVVGRGLRRTSYEINMDTNLFEPEYVNIFGVPFTFLPHEGGEDESLPSPPPIPIKPDPAKIQHKISWPNIDRIDVSFTTNLVINWKSVEPLNLKSEGIATAVGLAEVIAGKPDVSKMSNIDLHKINTKVRFQQIVFRAAAEVYDEISSGWNGARWRLFAQVVKIVERFIKSNNICVTDVDDDELRTKMTILFNMSKVVTHVCKFIRSENIESRRIIMHPTKPKGSTSDMRLWHTKKPTGPALKSHINLAVYDSTWEMDVGNELDQNEQVVSWVKNSKIGFAIKYRYEGVLHDYYPDFLIRLQNNINLVLEIKGRDDDQNREKRRYLDEWINVVNEDGNYGTWVWDVAFSPFNVQAIINKHTISNISAQTYAKCPRCGVIATLRQETEVVFGFCNVDGIIRPQSWCKKCRIRPMGSYE